MKRMKKTEWIYHQLLDRISSMNDGEEFPSVRELMEEFGASQFSVHPAIQKLQRQGMLESVVGRGSVVNRSRSPQCMKFLLLNSDWPNYGGAEFDKAIVMEAARRNHIVEIVNYDFQADVFGMLRQFHNYDAILLEPLRFEHFTPAQLDALLHPPAPTVICRAEVPLPGVNYVAGNPMLCGVAGANYLDRKGHRHIGILWAEPHDRTCCDLVSGFQAYAKLNELSVGILDCHTQYGENSLDNARRMLQNYLKWNRQPPFTALVVVSDETAIAALDTLEAEGYSVPQNLSVLSFGNVDIPGRYRGRLTSVGPPVDNSVMATLNMAEALARGETVPETQIKIAPEIREGFTVKNLNLTQPLHLHRN